MSVKSVLEPPSHPKQLWILNKMVENESFFGWNFAGEEWGDEGTNPKPIKKFNYCAITWDCFSSGSKVFWPPLLNRKKTISIFFSCHTASIVCIPSRRFCAMWPFSYKRPISSYRIKMCVSFVIWLICIHRVLLLNSLVSWPPFQILTKGAGSVRTNNCETYLFH